MRNPTREPRPNPFNGKLALVTGAGNGIGRSTALALAAAGAEVIAVDLDGDAAAKTAADTGGYAEVADVGDAEAMQALATRVHDEHGVLDVVVNNAGVGLSGHFLATSNEDWDWIMRVNLMGIVHGCRYFGEPMVARGSGHVVNVSSALGYIPRAGQIAYVTSKASALALGRSLRADWRRHGVGVSTVCPGMTATDIVSHTRFVGAHSDGKTKSTAEKMFKRGAKPEVVAEAILTAVRRNRSVVPVGIDGHLGWAGAHLLPDYLVNAIAGFGREIG